MRSKGWISGLVGEVLESQGAKFHYGKARIEDRAAVLADIKEVGVAALLSQMGRRQPHVALTQWLSH